VQICMAWRATMPVIVGTMIDYVRSVPQRTPLATAVGHCSRWCLHVVVRRIHVVDYFDVAHVRGIFGPNRRSKCDKFADLQAHSACEETHVATVAMRDYIESLIACPGDKSASRSHPLHVIIQAGPREGAWSAA
ncbi:MAG: hypothetical protein KGJ27_13650, partial [candidate division NC10 bacterium]|nr:hypothetical protein [candidate division NC10 bacterium]